METVVRQQQETISKLNEESQFLRSKFKLIESLLSKLTDNNHESDVNDYSPAAYVCSISGVTSPHEGEQLVNPLNSNSHANSVTSNNNDLLPSIADEPVYVNLNDINPKTKTTEVSAFKQRPLRDMNQCNPIKHLTPWPFQERKGICLKGSKCDFFHKPNHFQQRHHLKQYENLPFLEPLQYQVSSCY